MFESATCALQVEAVELAPRGFRRQRPQVLNKSFGAKVDSVQGDLGLVVHLMLGRCCVCLCDGLS